MAATKNVIEHCNTKHCVPALTGESKEEVLAELIETFVASGALNDDVASTAMGQVLAREDEGTTGIGGGVAMPHTRGCTDIDETMIAVGLHDVGVDWDSTDGEPVHVVFLIVSADPEAYLRVASRIARVARDAVEIRALRRQPNASSMMRFLKQSWK